MHLGPNVIKQAAANSSICHDPILKGWICAATFRGSMFDMGLPGLSHCSLFHLDFGSQTPESAQCSRAESRLHWEKAIQK